MNQALELDDIFEQAVSPYHEMMAYEALWAEQGASFKTIADKFKLAPNALPSELVTPERLKEIELIIQDIIRQYDVKRFGVRVNRTGDYPKGLRDARNPIEVLYYQGWWELINTPCVAIVGARKVSEEGILRTRKMVKNLVEDRFTIVSGLAEGVDTVAHTAAIELEGRTIGVIGTPLSHVYPKANEALQEKIRNDYLLISQVPFKHYEDHDYRSNRGFFPERNKTMSALTLGTIIIEASETSGTLHQARAVINQGRKLFILESCFQNPDITWPAKFEKKGAIRVKTYDDIRKHLDV